MAFYEEHKESEHFDGRELAARLEPVFREIGCRRLPRKGEAQKIIVLRDDAAGDFILSSAFQRELRRVYPKAHITLMVSARNYDFAQCCPHIDNIIVNNTLRSGKNFWQAFKDLAEFAVRELLPYHFALGFSGRLGIRSLSVLLLYMSGTAFRVAYTQDRPAGPGRIARIGWDDMISLPLPLLNEVCSDVDRDLFLLEGLLKLPIADRSLEVWTMASDREAAEQAVAPLRAEAGVKRLYAVMTETSQAFREWPLERFEEFFRWLLAEEEDVGLVFLGGPEKRARTEALAAKFPRRAICLAGRLSFRESTEVIGLCEKYIGDDTGLAHAAAAKRVPILDIFPFPASLGLMPMSCPVRFQPYGVPAVAVIPPEVAEGGDKCHLLNGTGCGAGEAHCILGVTVEKFKAAYRLLDGYIKEGRCSAVIMK